MEKKMDLMSVIILIGLFVLWLYCKSQPEPVVQNKPSRTTKPKPVQELPEADFKHVYNDGVVELWEKGPEDDDFVHTGDYIIKSKAAKPTAKAKPTTMGRLLQIYHVMKDQ